MLRQAAWAARGILETWARILHNRRRELCWNPGDTIAVVPFGCNLVWFGPRASTKYTTKPCDERFVNLGAPSLSSCAQIPVSLVNGFTKRWWGICGGSQVCISRAYRKYFGVYMVLSTNQVNLHTPRICRRSGSRARALRTPSPRGNVKFCILAGARDKQKYHAHRVKAHGLDPETGTWWWGREAAPKVYGSTGECR